MPALRPIVDGLDVGAQLLVRAAGHELAAEDADRAGQRRRLRDDRAAPPSRRSSRQRPQGPTSTRRAAGRAFRRASRRARARSRRRRCSIRRGCRCARTIARTSSSARAARMAFTRRVDPATSPFSGSNPLVTGIDDAGDVDHGHARRVARRQPLRRYAAVAVAFDRAALADRAVIVELVFVRQRRRRGRRAAPARRRNGPWSISARTSSTCFLRASAMPRTSWSYMSRVSDSRHLAMRRREGRLR